MEVEFKSREIFRNRGRIRNNNSFVLIFIATLFCPAQFRMKSDFIKQRSS